MPLIFKITAHRRSSVKTRESCFYPVGEEFFSRLIELKNVRVSFARPEDAKSFIDLQQRLAHESDFLLLSKEEINSDVEKQQKTLADFAKKDSPEKVLFAFYDDELVGYLGYRYMSLKKIQHVVRDIAAGVAQKFHRIGIAQKLFFEAEKEWLLAGKAVARISVIENNEKAFNLYTKLGFQVEGMENKSLCINGTYIGQKLMWKSLQSTGKE